jgi:hypothetical protein
VLFIEGGVNVDMRSGSILEENFKIKKILTTILLEIYKKEN